MVMLHRYDVLCSTRSIFAKRRANRSHQPKEPHDDTYSIVQPAWMLCRPNIHYVPYYSKQSSLRVLSDVRNFILANERAPACFESSSSPIGTHHQTNNDLEEVDTSASYLRCHRQGFRDQHGIQRKQPAATVVALRALFMHSLWWSPPEPYDPKHPSSLTIHHHINSTASPNR